MVKWGTKLHLLKFEPDLLFGLPYMPSALDTKIIEVFPDVHRLLVAKRLEEWGIDAGQIPIRSGGRDVAVMAAFGIGVVYVHLPSLKRAYPKNRYQYLPLAHELAHMLQFVENRMDLEGAAKWHGIHEWATLEHELDAMRWQAREAKRMGIGRQEFEKILHWTFPQIAHELALETRPVFSGTWPEERGVRPMFRRPVRVRQHRRQKR